MKYLSTRLAVLALFAVLVLFETGCGTSYRKVETIKLGINTTVFTHEHADYSVTIICRKAGGTATVSGQFTNLSSSPVTLNDRIALHIGGKQVFQRSNAKKTHILKPGESVELPCDYIFRHQVKRGGEIIALGDQEVSVEIDTYKSPAIYLNLSADNQVPFRFARYP